MDSLNLRAQFCRAWRMGVSSRRAFSWLHLAALDGPSCSWLFIKSCALCMDLLSGLGCINLNGNPRGKRRAETCWIIQAAPALGGAILCLCMASDVVCCLRDGNPFTWIHCIRSAGRADERFTSLSDFGPACRSKHLGPARRLDIARPDIICRFPV